MPRSGSGSYTLPTGNPVVSGTTIEANWANNTLNDVATTLTDSLSRSGQGGMTAAFRAADGSASVPGVAWSSETGTGFYRAGSGDTRFVVSTTEVQKWLSTGTAITGTLSATGNLSTGTASPVFGSGSGVEIERAGIATLRLENSSASNSFELYADSAANGINLRGRDSSPMNFWTGNTLQATLDSSGNLGIGVTPMATGANGAQLQIGSPTVTTGAGLTIGCTTTADIQFSDATSGAGQYAGLIRYSHANDSMGFWTASTERARIDSSGNLSVGTVTAVEKLTVWAGNAYVLRSGGAKLRLADQLNEVSFESVPVGSSSDAIWKTSSLERMRLDSSGNLGLGVTPSAWNASATAIEQKNGVAWYSFGAASNSNFVTNAFANSAGNFIYKTTDFASRYQQISGQHAWYTAPSGTAGAAISFGDAKMTLDASGNLGVGTTGASYSAKLDVVGTGSTSVPTNLSDLSGALILVESTRAGTGYGGVGYSDSSGGGAAVVFGRGGSYDTQILFCTNPLGTNVAGAMTERARITSGGDWLVNTTSVGAGLGATFKETVVSDAGEDGVVISCSSASAANLPLGIINTATSGNNSFAGFYTEATPTIRGSISYNRAGALVNYGTTSDYRAKDIIGPVQNPGATIDALKVYEGVMKGATQSRPMLIAHEAQEHAPYAVSGVKDEVNEDGTPKFQQMDVSSLVPLLLAEIQSLRARVAALEAA